jgi:undecaprenyl-diphosphatase
MNLFDAMILGIVEGLTEFLPVSSTGHMILVSSLLKLQNQEFSKTFEIAIQLGAIFAIVALYARRLLCNITIYKKLAVAFLPSAVVGFFAYKIIKMYLFNSVVVSVALVIGGIILILLDKKVINGAQKHINTEDIPYKNALLIGVFQSISVIPGVSRAAATIIGGVFNGFDKRQATEFSFLLAIPTMFAATGYDLLKTPVNLTGHEFLLIGIGGIVSFISAWIAVKLFLRLIEKHGFMIFGYYRIALGLLFLWFFGFDLT